MPANSDPRLIADLEAFIPEVMRVGGVPGLNVAVARRGEVVWEAGFGHADLARGIAMTPRTVMRTGSMGKLYTATAVMQLVEQGVLGLHDPLDAHLPQVRVVNPLGERAITVYDLLTHRGGLTGDGAGSDFVPAPPLAEHIAAELRQPTLREEARTKPRWSARVGARYEYSNFGLALLGYLVEVTNPEGLAFCDYVQRHIFDPLGMTSTQFPALSDYSGIRPDLVERMAVGYAGFGRLFLPTPTVVLGDYPAGTSVTTPGDHIRLLLAMRNGGELAGARILQPETVRQMLTPRVRNGIEDDSWTGLIWRISNPGTRDESIWHTGSYMFGWDNYGGAYPALDVAVVAMTNTWNVVGYGDPETTSPVDLVQRFVADWLRNEQVLARREPIPRGWAWKTSYVIGLHITEQLHCVIGIPNRLTSEMVEAMAHGASGRTGMLPDAQHWDADGFRAGVADMLSVEMTPPAIHAFVASNRLQVLPQEIELVHREQGGRRDAPIPSPYR